VSTAATTPSGRTDAARAGFRPLRVAALERLTDDAVAVSFEVPAQLRAVFAPRPGQHVTLRTVLDGTEVRRTYSLCGEPGAELLTVGIKAVPDGAFSRFALDRLGSATPSRSPRRPAASAWTSTRPGPVTWPGWWPAAASRRCSASRGRSSLWSRRAA
jgi:ring-1,2-phenylacetyl-CoA epoxidase subunit PaaE